MQKKLFLSNLIMIGLILCLSFLVFWTKGYRYLDNQSKNYYLMQTNMLRDAFYVDSLKDIKEYSHFLNNYASKYKVRITLIDQDGTVITDTQKTTIKDNHGTREEVANALKGKSTIVTRYSKTMQKEYVYCAVPLEVTGFQGVLRLSLPLMEMKQLDSNLHSGILIAVILSIVIAVILAAIFARILSKPIYEIAKAAERISDGDYTTKIYTKETGQIGQLAASFNKMSTNLKTTIVKLTERNTELEAMLSSMDSGVVAINEGNAVLFYNQSFYNLIESNSKTLNGKSLYNIIRNALIFDVIEEVRTTGSTVRKEGTLEIETEKMIRVTGEPLSKEGGKKIGVLLILEDITERRKLETIRSDFVSNVTHELKTPLTSIRGFIETLKSGTVHDKEITKRFLDIIDIEAERLYDLIQDILLLSEIESRRESQKQWSEPGAVITEALALLEPKCQEDVSLHWEMQDKLPVFYCNPNRIKQLVINLVDNAIKYTEKGSITITCREEKGDLVLWVSDTGIGIEKDVIERIFERFYRVDKGRSRKQGGTGLGLSIVKHIVELYNGTILVESEPGKGSCFEIRLPYAACQVESIT